MKKYLLIAMAICAFGPARARADLFQLSYTESGTEYKMYNDVANKDVNFFHGYVGGQSSSNPTIDISTTGKVDTGSGYANIKPAKSGSLTDLIFTPETSNTSTFGDFYFRGQLLSAGSISITVTATNGEVDHFTTTSFKKDADFGSVGITPVDSTNPLAVIKSVEISFGDGFKEVKQIDWSLAAGSGPPPAVPEPSTMVIATLGAIGFLGYGLRRRKAS